MNLKVESTSLNEEDIPNFITASTSSSIFSKIAIPNLRAEFTFLDNKIIPYFFCFLNFL